MASLVKELQSRDLCVSQKAFNKIYEEYRFLVFYILLKMIKDRDASQDLLNEVFMNFYLKRGEIYNEKHLAFYLAKSAKNRALNYLKEENRYTALNIEVSVNDPHDDFKDFLANYKEILSEEEMTLLVYRFVYDLSFKEIAQIENQNFNTTKSQYFRIIGKLRNYYEVKKNG